MIVVACQNCGFGRIAQSGMARTKCSHCGRNIDVRKAVKHYDGSDVEKARSALFIINAGMKPASEPQRAGRSRPVPDPSAVGKRKNKSLAGFISEHDCFTAGELSDYLETGMEGAETHIRKLVESGIIYSPSRGMYCVVR